MKYFVGILALLLGAGRLYYFLRDDPLRNELNKQWPPISAEQQRQAAVNKTAAVLIVLPHPNIAAGVHIKTIEQLAFQQLHDKGITKLVLTTDHQLLRLSVEFDRTFSADDLPQGSDKRDLITKLSPHIAGTLDVFLGAAAGLVEQPDKHIQVKLLPAIHSAHIEKITLVGSADISVAGEALNYLVNRYADNLTAVISNSPLLDLSLPATLQDSFDPSGPIKLTIPDAPGVKFALISKPIKSPFGLAGVALLIDGGQFTALAQLVPLANMPAEPSSHTSTFDAMRAAFLQQLKDGMDISPLPSGIWAAIGKSLMAASLNSAFDQTGACFTAKGPVPKESFSKKVSIPDETTMDCTTTDDCTPTKDCTPTGDCTPTQDCTPTRDCSQTEDCSQHCECRKRAFGICVNDPVCESEKVIAKGKCEASKDGRRIDCERIKSTEKGKCEADKSARKLDCERLKTQTKDACEIDKTSTKLACETAKTTKKGLCETAKEGLKRISRTGNLANIDGNISGKGDFKVCLQHVHFADAMNSLSMDLKTNGSAVLDTNFKFVPLDIVGHLACPADWTADKRITASVPDQSIPASLTLTGKYENGIQSYDGNLKDTSIKLYFSPSPTALVLQNINFLSGLPSCRCAYKWHHTQSSAVYTRTSQKLHICDQAYCVFGLSKSA